MFPSFLDPIQPNIRVPVVRIDQGLPLPTYSRPGDAGMDLFSSIDYILHPSVRKLIPTGIALAIPEGYAGFIHPRSGLAHKSGITVVNAPGTVDSGYRGEIFVNLLNTDLKVPFLIERGDRIAQIVFQPVTTARFLEVDSLDETERGANGHGSSGVKSADFNIGGPV